MAERQRTTPGPADETPLDERVRAAAELLLATGRPAELAATWRPGETHLRYK